MKNVAKKVILSGVAALSLGVSSGSISADSVDVNSNSTNTVQTKENPIVSAEFDLNNLPTAGQSKTVKDINGKTNSFSIVPENNPLLRVSNGSHKIVADGIGWHVQFYINTKNNNITSAHDLSYSIMMPVASRSLSRDSNKRATAHFDFNTPVWNILSWNGWVRATINGSNNIVISHN